MIKSFLTAILLIISMSVAAQTYMLLPIDVVHDGDTIETDIGHRLPEPLNHISIRLYGIDTPEMPAASYATTGKLGRAKCVKEAELALKARDRLIELVGPTKIMQIKDYKWGKFGGRVVGKVYIQGQDVAQILIKEGLGIPYFGGKKIHNWCQ